MSFALISWILNHSGYKNLIWRTFLISYKALTTAWITSTWITSTGLTITT